MDKKDKDDKVVEQLSNGCGPIFVIGLFGVCGIIYWVTTTFINILSSIFN